MGKYYWLTIELNLSAYLLVNSKCCFWSSPTGTKLDLYSKMSAAMRTGYEYMPKLLFWELFYLYCIIILSQCWGPMQPNSQHSYECSATSDWIKRIVLSCVFIPLLIKYLAISNVFFPILPSNLIWACSRSNAVVSECKSAINKKVWASGCFFLIENKF